MNQAPASVASLRCRVLTGPGPGAIAVIRVRGIAARATVDRLFQPSGRLPSDAPHTPDSSRLRFGLLTHQGQHIDEAILAWTTMHDGTEQVDLNVHGGVRVVQRLLVALQSLGVRVAEPGDSDPPDWPAEHLVDVDAYQALAGATTRRAVEFLLHQRVVLASRLMELSELAQQHPDHAKEGLLRLLDSSRTGKIMTQGATVAILGPPNAGKSTLANRLFGRTMSMVADAPGVTRDWVAQPMALDGIPMTLLDTAGLGQPANADQSNVMQRGLQRWRQADLHLLVLDGADDWPADLVQGLLGVVNQEHLLVTINKSDRPRRWHPDRLPPALLGRACEISATTGQGLPALQAAIVADLMPPEVGLDQPSLFAARQRHCVRDVLACSVSSGTELSWLIRRNLLGRGLSREFG